MSAFREVRNGFLVALILIGTVLVAFQCSREHSNPLDPASKEGEKKPEAPTGLKATRENGKITLTWDAVADPDLVGYMVYRALDRPESPEQLDRQTGRRYGVYYITTEETSYTDDDALISNRTYYYMVRALNKDGFISESSDWLAVLVP